MEKLELKSLFLERMKELLKEDFEKYLGVIKKQPRKSIRVNTLKISPDKLKERLEKKGWKIKQPFKDYLEIIIVEGKYTHLHSTPPQFENSINNKKIIANKGSNKLGVVNLEPGELGRSLEHRLGYYYVQELSSTLPVNVLNPKENEIILDLAAAPGSKTTQISAKTKNTGTIIANDFSLARIKILASNLERCGAANCIITKKDGRSLCIKLKKQNFYFDKILIDAPCSGEGTLRSSPKTAKMWNIKNIENLSKIQKQLLSYAIETLKTQGEIVYSTCTHAPEENEEVIDFILEKFKDKIKVEKINLPIKHKKGVTKWQNKEYSREVKKCCRIYPQNSNTEGFFITKLKKIKE